MRLSRYYQQEQLTDRSPNVFQSQPFTSPFETIGAGASAILERITQQDERAYAAAESAKALSRISEVADGIVQEIDAGKILDQQSLENEMKTRVDKSFETMQLQPRIRRAIEPDVIQHMATYGIKLKHALNIKRGEIEINNLNTALDSFKRAAVDADTPAELAQTIDTIRGTVDKVEGSFLTSEQKAKYLQSTMDEIHSSRARRMLRNPYTNPADVQSYLNEHKEEITPELFEKLNDDAEQERQNGIKNETINGLQDQIIAAENNGSIGLAEVRKQIDSNRKIFQPETIFSLHRMVDQVENRRRAEAAERVEDQGQLVLDQVKSVLFLENDPDKATAILQKNRSLLDQHAINQVGLEIDLARKRQVDQKQQQNLATNVEFFQNRIDTGEFDSLTSQQMRDQIISEVEMNKNLPGESAPILMNSYFNRLRQVGESKQTLQLAIEKMKAGQYLDQKETDLAYKNRPEADQNDPAWMDKEISFAAKTAKNIPTAWIDFTKSARLLDPSPGTIPSIYTAAEYVIKLSKENPSVANSLDKETLRLLPTYWDRAGKIADMKPEAKVEVWKNLLKTQYSPNDEIVDKISQSTDYGDIKDRLWADKWDWYSKFAPEQANTQTEYFRNEPEIPDVLKLHWGEKFKEQLKATTGEDGIPNFDRAAEYAYHQIFQDWGLTEAYGNIRWQYHPIDQHLRKTPFDLADLKDFIDAEVRKGIGKNVIRAGMGDPIAGTALSFENPAAETIEESQITLEYMPNSERDNPKSGIPSYFIMIDGDVQPVEGGYLGIKGDDLYQYLANRKAEKNKQQINLWSKERDSLNQEMELMGAALSGQTGQIPD